LEAIFEAALKEPDRVYPLANKQAASGDEVIGGL
jgi:hypothetical protein